VRALLRYETLYANSVSRTFAATRKFIVFTRWRRVRDFSSMLAFLRGISHLGDGASSLLAEGHVPEYRIRQHELHSHLRLRVLIFSNVRDNTLQRSFCLDVRQSEPLSSVHLRRHENRCTVSTDRQCLSLSSKGDPRTFCPRFELGLSSILADSFGGSPPARRFRGTRQAMFPRSHAAPAQ